MARRRATRRISKAFKAEAVQSAAEVPVIAEAAIEEAPLIEATPEAETYNPANDTDGFMNPVMRSYFREKLSLQGAALRLEIELAKAARNPMKAPDPTDRALEETSMQQAELLNSTKIKRLQQIEAAIRRIDNEEYGYCIETDEPIDVARLLANMTALRTVEAQSRLDMKCRQYRAGAPGLDAE